MRGATWLSNLIGAASATQPTQQLRPALSPECPPCSPRIAAPTAGLFNLIGPSFGLPFVTGSLPHSPQLVKSLTIYRSSRTPLFRTAAAAAIHHNHNHNTNCHRHRRRPTHHLPFFAP